MFVPHKVTIAPVRHISRRVPTFAIVALLLAAIPTFALPSGTLSYFSDDERSTGNTFAAGPLDFAVSPDHTSATLMLGLAGETFILTTAPVAGSLPFRYKVSGAASGNATFCAAISASGGTPLPYSGSIISFTTGDTNSFSPWSLVLSLPSPAPGVVDGQVCILDLTFEAYQDGGVAGTEYHDTEHVILTLTADPPIVAPPSTFASEEIAPLADTPLVEVVPPLTDPTPPTDITLPVVEDTTPPADQTPPPADTPPIDTPAPPAPDAPAQ